MDYCCEHRCGLRAVELSLDRDFARVARLAPSALRLVGGHQVANSAWEGLVKVSVGAGRAHGVVREGGELVACFGCRRAHELLRLAAEARRLVVNGPRVELSAQDLLGVVVRVGVAVCGAASARLLQWL